MEQTRGYELECSEGVLVTGATEDEFVSNLELHLREAHPEVQGRLSREEILRLAGPPGDRLQRGA